MERGLSWPSILRLGLVQTALGAVVVLTTSTLNRVMVVEVGLAAVVPGALVGLHHAMQLLRPRMGHGADVGRRYTLWIVGGMFVLAAGGVLAAVATALLHTDRLAGAALAVLAFALIGGGVSSAGTSLLVFMAKRVAPDRRAAAATIVWSMMIAGFAVTATVAGRQLDPFSYPRLVAVAAAISAIAVVLATLAMWGLERGEAPAQQPEKEKPPFRVALRAVWAEPNARRFTVFVLASMLAYSAQDLILEPFSGAVFAFTPGESTSLSGVQHGGVFSGMMLLAAVTTLFRGTPLASLKGWVAGGSAASAVAMAGLFAAAFTGPPWPLKANVFLLGMANGAFSIAAIGAMMSLASQDGGSREGVRMGLWGAAQAIAFGTGGFIGTVLADAARLATGSPASAYAFVFAAEAVGFVVSCVVALSVSFGGAAVPEHAAGASLAA